MALLLLCSVSVYAHDFEVDGVYYKKLTYNTVEVTFKGTAYNTYSNEYSGNVVIPSKVTYNSSTYTVKSIGKEAFCSCSALTSISMPTTITKIDEYAFQLCTGLTNIVIPSSVTTIAYGAFIDCTGLLSATIPSSVTTIESRAFSYCSNLEKVTMANGVTKIGDYAFYLCEKLNELTLSNNIIEIGKEAFLGCDLLSEITLPEPLTTMGLGVFAGCGSLKTIYIPNKVTTIPTNAFQNCYNLETVILGNSVTTIEKNAFNYCNNIKTLIKPSSLTIDDYYLKYAEKTINATDVLVSNNLVFGKISSVYNLITYLGKESDLTLPNYCTGTTKYIIGSDVFSSSTTLKSVTIPSTVTSIGTSAFKNSSSLESITIPSSVKTIGNDAFYGCSALKNVTIPSNLTSIEANVFSYCSALENISIPSSVKTIGNNAFSYCSALTSITIPITINSIGSYAFTGCSSLRSVSIPGSVTSIGEYAFNSCSALKEVHTSSINNWCANVFLNATSNPLNYAKNLYVNDELVTDLVIPEIIEAIKDYSFYNCTSLTSVELPKNVKAIGNLAFYGCSSLKTVKNHTSLEIVAGEKDNGYVAYYAEEVIGDEAPESEFLFEVIDGVNTLVEYAPRSRNVTTQFEDWTSTNKGSNTTSTQIYTFDVTVGAKLTFDWSVSSEEDYDWLYIYLDGTRILKKSGLESGSYEKVFTTDGTHELKVTYSKDGSTNSRNDNAIISNVCLRKTIDQPEDVVLPENYNGENYIIGGHVFKGNDKIKSVVIPNTVISIGEEAFANCVKLSNITIPNSVKNIGVSAFNGCINILSIEIPGSVTNLERGVFATCTSLESVVINEGVETIGSDVQTESTVGTFEGCVKLSNVTIPEGLTSIGKTTFNGCSSMIVIELPATLESIAEGAFMGCTNLNKIVCQSTISPMLDGVVFEGLNFITCELEVPDEAISNYVNSENEWSKFRFTNNQIVIRDGKESTFFTSTNRDCDKVTYTRTLPNLNWNALYVPFEIDVEDIVDKYEVAYINAVHSYDKDDDGEIDELEMEVIKVKAGTTKANYPYLIKARNDEAKSVNISVEGATLYASTEKTLDCSSVYQKFEITGSYSRKSAAELSGKLAISLDGAWQPLVEGSFLNPFRLYLSISNRNDAPLKVNPLALSRVRIVEDGMTTGILDLTPATQKDNVIYDFSGRRVIEPRKGQLYIVNGKKVVY